MENLGEFVRGASRIAIVGVGSDMRGDDGAGVAVVRELRKSMRSDKVLLVEGGVSPESFTGRIRDFGPSHVVLIDAADFGGTAGEVRMFERASVCGAQFSTHNISLSLLSEYMRREFRAKVIFIGIQPSNARFRKRMGPEVRRSVSELSAVLCGFIT